MRGCETAAYSMKTMEKTKEKVEKRKKMKILLLCELINVV